MEAVYTNQREGRLAYQVYSTVEIDATGSWLAFGREKAVYMRSLQDWGQAPIRVGEHGARVVEVAFHPDSERIAAIDESAEIRIWSTASPSPRMLRSTQADEVYLIQFDPGGRWLIGHDVVDGRPTVRLWDMTAPQGVEPLTLQRSDRIWSHQVVVHPTQPWLLTAHGDDAGFWPLSGRYPWVLRGHKELVRKVAFSPDGDWLISAAHEGVRAWPLKGQNGGASRILVDRELGAGPTIDFHPSGRSFAVGLEGGTALIVPLEGGSIREFGKSDPSVWGTVLAFSPSGRLLATIPSKDPRTDTGSLVRLWNLESGEVQDLGQVPGESSHLEFTDENHVIWIGSGGMGQEEGGGERVFDLETGEVTVLAEDGREMARAVGESGKFAITLDYGDSWTHLFRRDLETGESRQIFSHGDAFGGVAIDPSDQWMATGDYFGVVRVGRVNGEEPHLLLGHRGSVSGVAFSPDGQWIATGGDDGTVRLWPTPDLSKPPFHTLPHDELMAKLKSL
ncbi:MAG: WD40 repeat domain-containing protein, partial [Thermoanaerobaculia bacterium]